MGKSFREFMDFIYSVWLVFIYCFLKLIVLEDYDGKVIMFGYY